MCEIFIIDPEENSVEVTVDNAEDMFESNPDGLGVVAVYRHEDAGMFEYEMYKEVEFNRDDVTGFVDSHQDAWRMIVHARLGTHGEKDILQAHPIHVRCDDCAINAIIHNGVVSAEATWRETLVNEGHDFNTEVDSEVIAHEHSEVPEDIEDLEEPELSGSLNYILLQEDRILIRSGLSYRDTDEGLMGKRKRCEWEDESRSTKFILAKPDGTIQTEKTRNTRRNNNNGNNGWNYSGVSRGSRQSGNRRSRSGSSGSQDGSTREEESPWQEWEDWPPEHLAPTN